MSGQFDGFVDGLIKHLYKGCVIVKFLIGPINQALLKMNVYKLNNPYNLIK